MLPGKRQKRVEYKLVTFVMTQQIKIINQFLAVLYIYLNRSEDHHSMFHLNRSRRSFLAGNSLDYIQN